MIISGDHERHATEIPFTLEALTQAGIIFIMGVAIILTNALIIATFLNYRGK
jgi:hydrogenase-4 membrane subunit HyfE